MTQRHDKALVTLAVGEAYLDGFRRHTRPTWEAYCARRGYDLVVLTEPIDRDCDFTRKSVHWQKLLIGLVPRLKDYRHLVWVDGDIVINHRLAPCIVSHLKEDRIGVVDASADFLAADAVYNRHARFLILNYLMTRQLDPQAPKAVVTGGDLSAYYRLLGLHGTRATRFINTGVIVFEPARHARFLAECYARYERDSVDFENTPVSFELQEHDACEYLDTRFNLIWAHVAAKHYPFLFNQAVVGNNRDLLKLCANIAFHNAWFLHFAGGSKSPVIKGAYPLIDDSIDGIPALVFPEAWRRRDEYLRFAALDALGEEGRALGAETKDYLVLF